MKSYFNIPFIVVTLLFMVGCSNTQSTKERTSLTAAEFSEKMTESKNAQIIDVRTAEEYSNGHIQHAMNIDWNGNTFEKQISLFDTSKPVFVYCLSGKRSAAAAAKMRSMGFSNVYELEGGILTWRTEGLPETTDKTFQSQEMTKQQFDSLLVSDKLVLVDFYAPWCAPCKQMKPDLDALEMEMKDQLIILRIDADDNQSLTQELHIEVLPTLLLYKNKNLVWSHTGYMSKADIYKQLK